MHGLTPSDTSKSRAGMVQSVSSPSVVAPTTLGYDGHGRQISSKDPRTGLVTTTTYDPVSGQVATVTGPGHSAIYTYYTSPDPQAGQLKSASINGQVTYQSYDALGRLNRRWGATNPVRYDYDDKGRLYKMYTYQTRSEAEWMTATWPATDTEGNYTYWNYFPGTNLVQSKADAVGQATTYTYWSYGLLKERIWARPGALKTTYTYNTAGELKMIDYSDTTPDVTMNYNALGRISSVSDAAGTHTLIYDAGGQLELESITGSGKILEGLAINPRYTDAAPKGRIDQLGVTMGPLSMQPTFGYHPFTGQLNAVGFGPEAIVRTANYTYLTNSDWIANMTLKEGSVTKLTTSWVPDIAARLATVSHTAKAQIFERHDVHYNAAGQRDRVTQLDGSLWNFGYNGRGEVIAGNKKWSDGTPVAGQQFGYQFDPIGNRTTTSVNGRSAAYTTHATNRYLTREVAGAVDVSGEATPETTVTVNEANAARRGSYFYKEVPVANTTAPVWTNITITGVRNQPPANDAMTEAIRHAYVPRTPETFTHDEDGNLLTDGRWNYTWDCENRLIAMETNTAAMTAGVARQKLVFYYDWKGRRIRKTVYSGWTGSSYAAATATKFAYDEGWNLLAELDGTTNAVIRRYFWGLDLSGTRHGAGGIGGLLAVQQVTGVDAGYYLPTCDFNGNVTTLINSTAGTEAARYAYGPFGEPLRATGTMAVANPFRFSTKYADQETGLLYYGYRYYQPTTGRWLSRDPLGERGGQNWFCFVKNRAIGLLDPLGLETWIGGTLQEPAWAPAAQDWQRSLDDYRLYFNAHGQAPGILLFSVPAYEMAIHYLNGSGAPKNIYFNEFIQDEKMQPTLANDANDAVTFSMQQTSSGDIRSQNWTEFESRTVKWGLAIATAHWAGDGHLNLIDRKRTLFITYRLFDPYDFQNNPDNYAGVGLSDADWFRLHKVGLAKEFIVRGETTLVIQWCDQPKRSVRSSEILKGDVINLDN